MPISQLSTRTGAFPVIGILRKGAKKTNEKQPGADLNQLMRFVSDDDPDTEREFAQAVGGLQIAQVKVLLPYRDYADNLIQWGEEWNASELLHRCDGERCVVWRTSDGVRHYATQEPAPPCPGGCKWTSVLYAFVPALKRLALVRVVSTSKYDAGNLLDNLKAIYALGQRNDCRGIPLLISRRKHKVPCPVIDKATGRPTGQRIRRVKWLLHLEVDPDWSAAMLDWEMQQALPANFASGQLNATKPQDVLAENSTFVTDVPPAVEKSGLHVDEKSPFAVSATDLGGEDDESDENGETGDASGTPEGGVEEGHFVPIASAAVNRSAAELWRMAAVELAETWTMYRRKDGSGKPDHDAMLALLAEGGITLVTTQNVGLAQKFLADAAQHATMGR